MRRMITLAVLLAGCASQPKVERFEPDATDTIVIVREDARFDPADAVVVVPPPMVSASEIDVVVEEPAEPVRKRLKKH